MAGANSGTKAARRGGWRRLLARNAPEPERLELGWSGVSVFGGVIADEYHPELRGVRAIQTADRMRRTDGQVRAVEKVISLPIRSTAWLLEEPDGAGHFEREATSLLRRELFGGMEQSWDDVLREACLAIYYGFRIPEIVWEEREGRIALRGIASRNPELVERWLYDAAGRLVGYRYTGHRPRGGGLDDPTGSRTEYRSVSVPLEKTIHFAYDAENGNPRGFGLWRSIYPHWYFKQALYRILGIGIERNLLGVPVGKAGEGAQADDKRAMLTLLRRLRAAEDASIVLPPGWEVEWFESRRSLLDAMPFLHHQNVMIAQTALAQFLNLGQQGAGTQALAVEHARLFLEAEEANARWIEETLNRQLVRRWCRLNYGEELRPPVIRHRRLQADGLGAISETLARLVGGGLLHPTRDDEEYLRDLAELPPIPAEQRSRRDAGAETANEARATEEATNG